MSYSSRRRLAAPLAAVVLSLLAAAPVSAQWTGKGEAGLVVSTGNAETVSGNAKLSLARAVDSWTHKVSVAAVYVANDVDTTAQRYEGAAQSQFRFSTRNFWFGSARYEDDRFSGFNYQAALSTGIGHQFIDTKETKLSGQLGLGYKQLETKPVFAAGTGALLERARSEGSLGLFANADYSHAFNASTTLSDKLTIEGAADNTFLQNEISLSVKMSDRLALALGYAIRHNTDPPPGFQKTDTLSTVNVVYEIR